MKPRVRIRNGKPLFSTIEKPPNKQLIAHVEKILLLAKQGRARSIIEVLEWDDGSVTDGHYLSDNARENSMLGSMFTALLSVSFRHTSHYEDLRDAGALE